MRSSLRGMERCILRGVLNSSSEMDSNPRSFADDGDKKEVRYENEGCESRKRCRKSESNVAAEWRRNPKLSR